MLLVAWLRQTIEAGKLGWDTPTYEANLVLRYHSFLYEYESTKLRADPVQRIVLYSI